MRILALSNCSLDPTLGSGKTRRAWSEGLRARGHTVETLDSDELLGPARDQPRGRRLRLGRQAWKRLGATDLSRFDLVEFFGAEFWLPTWRLSLRPRGKRPLLVAHTDGLEPLAAERGGATGWRAALVGAADRLAFSRADAFVTGCEADRRYALAHRLCESDRAAVVPLGLDAEYLADPAPAPDRPEREERVAFFGSWIARKGHGVIVAVMTELLRARPGLRLSLLGTGGAEKSGALGDFPAELRGRIEVPGKLPTAACAEILSRAKVFLFPSEYEGFGLALAEAMACGGAAVTTPTGFGAELRDGVEARVCAFGDAGAMRAAVAGLLDDDAARVRLAAAGQRRARALRWETSVDQLEAKYQGWLGER